MEELDPGQAYAYLLRMLLLTDPEDEDTLWKDVGASTFSSE